MLPIAPLMIEHRLIEQMTAVIRKEVERCESEGNINPEYMTDFYPKHIEKEDKRFFLPCMNYFTQEEKKPTSWYLC